MVQCTEIGCDIELFEKDVVATELDRNGDNTNVYRCPKCFKLKRWTE